MRIVNAIADSLAAQDGHQFPWAAVCFACGIAMYFGLAAEPGPWVWGMGAAGLVLGGISVVKRLFYNVGWAALLVGAGFAIAAARANLVAAPVLDFRYYGPVEGRLIARDRSQSDFIRLTLDQVRLDRVDREKTPARVRITARNLSSAPPIGTRIMTTAHLTASQGPVEPGGFDFRRHLWFLRIGAIGYTRVPVLISEPASTALPVARLRETIARDLQLRFPGDGGAVAAAVLTGDRSGLRQDTIANLRASNLAHLLAISGLHMGLLTAVVFGGARIFLVAAGLILGRNLAAKRAAAFLALIAACAYLAISGGNVATERAFVMTAVVLGAVLLGRRALTLRAVAIAALIVLVHRPENLMSPGFQMSFAATTALVGVFAAIRQHDIRFGPKWIQPVVTLLVSSAVAGLATAPFGAAHFNTASHFGLLANLLSVPVMGSVVMPAAVLAVVGLPFGAQGIGLWLMVRGLEWILWIAQVVAQFPHTQSYVSQPAGWVLPALALGGLFCVLYQGRAKVLGVVAIVIALVNWNSSPRPAVLIASDGGLVGVSTETGRALSKPRGSGFTARVWLENDGAPVSQERAAQKWTVDDPWMAQIQIVSGKRAATEFTGCQQARVVVSNVALPPASSASDCWILTPEGLKTTGSIAISANGRVTTARAAAGVRLWSPPGWRLSTQLPQTLPITVQKAGD